MRTSLIHIAHRPIRSFFSSTIGVLGLILATLVPGVHAQTNWWTPVDGPYGGTTVWDLERLPDGSIIAATSNGLHRSVDDGYTWSGFSEGLTMFDVRDIHVDANGAIRIATFGHGLFSRSDASASWEPAGLSSTYATSLLEPEPGVLLAGVNGYVYRSEDGGASWSARSLEGYSVWVQSMTANDSYVFAATNLGIFRSADAGLTWEFASFGLQDYDVQSIESNELGHIFAGVQPSQGGCSLYRSRGNGALWTCVQPDTDPLTVPLIKSGPDGKLFAGGFRNLYQSSDEGGTWISRRAAGSNVQSILFLGNGLLIGTHGQGILRSQDAGITWQASNTGLQSTISAVRALPDGRVVAGTSGGLFQTDDLGTSWSRVHVDMPLIQHITDVALDAEGRLLAASTAGIWRHDEVDGWSALGPPGMPAVRDLQITDDGTILAGYHAGVWIHSGTSWTNSGITGPDLASRDVGAVYRTEGGSILAGASWDSWRRESGEPVWQLMSAGDLAWFGVQAFVESGDRILAGTKFSGVLQSFDDGQSWFPLGVGLVGSEDIRDIDIDSRGTPYIATYGSGVYQLNRWTNTWLPVLSGLDGHWRVTSMTHDSYGNAWIGTVDGGIFRHGNSGVSIEDHSSTDDRFGTPAALQLGAPWPNPSNGVFRIPVKLDRGQVVRMELFDMLGKRIAQSERTLPAGSSEIEMSPSIQASGVYWIRVVTDSGQETRPITLQR